MTRRNWSPAEVRTAIAEGRITRERSCDGKVRFANSAHAEKARTDIERRHQEPGSLQSYPCPFCAGWHFTHSGE